MSLVFIPNTVPSYIALSTDISGSKISGASYIGAKVYLTDTAKSYIIMPDLTLEEVPTLDDTVTVIGSVDVDNFPADYLVSGSVTVSNFPTDYPVSGSLIAEVSNFPADYLVSGSVTVSNFPTDYPVSGSLIAEVSNFPVEYPVSGSVILLDSTASIGSVIVSEMPIGGYAYGSEFLSGVSGSIVDNTATQVIASAGSALSIHLTTLMVTNSGATGTNVDITSGSAGTAMWRGYAVGEGGGFAVTFPVPLRFDQGAGVFIKCQETTDIAVLCSAAGYKA